MNAIHFSIWTNSEQRSLLLAMTIAPQELSPTRRKSWQRRAERILAEASQLIVDDGLDEFSLHRLSGRLGYSVGALYRYFPSRDALLAELQRRAIARFTERLEQATNACELCAARGGATTPGWSEAAAIALARLRTAAALVLRQADEAPVDFMLLSLSIGHPRAVLGDEAARTVLATAGALAKLVTELFETAAKVGALQAGDAKRRALAFAGALHGVLQLRKLGRLAPALIDTQGLASETIDALLRGWGADAALQDTATALAAAASSVVIPETPAGA